MKTKIILIAIIILAALLRLYALDRYPWGLNADEAAIGYNAYSLLETGKDEHGTTWPLTFRSFDDYKPPVYFYLVLPFVKILGLNIWAVRLPSALLGVATVYLVYLLAGLIYPTKKYLGLIAAFLLAISPWHLQYSRGGWEVNASLFFLTLGLWAFYKGLKNGNYFVISTTSFVISMYTYHSLRVVAPLIVIYLLVSYRKRLFSHFDPKIIISPVLAVALLLPLAFQFLGTSGGSARFAGVSIFADQGPLNYVLEMRRTSDQPNSLLTKIRYNRYSAYAGEFLNNIALHLSPAFLFISGDELARNKVPNMGQSYLWTLPFFFLGLLVLLKKLNKESGLILFWLLVGIFPAAITFQSPHALRSENIVVPLMILIAAGIWSVSNWIKSQNLKIVFLGLLLIISIFSLKYYLNQYYVVYPKTLGYAWQPGFDSLAEYFKEHDSEYDKIIVSTRYDQPYILVAFFLKYDPNKFQQELVFSTPDRFGFSTGLEFGKYSFHPIEWAKDSLSPDTLIVVADEPVPAGTTPVKTILFPDGSPVFTLYQTK